MNELSYFCIYIIGFLLTYKYVLNFYLSDVERFSDPVGRQVVSLLSATFWIPFWIATFFIPVPEDSDDN